MIINLKLIIGFFGKGRDWDSERLCNFLSATQLSSGKAGLKSNILVAYDSTTLLASFPISEKSSHTFRATKIMVRL